MSDVERHHGALFWEQSFNFQARALLETSAAEGRAWVEGNPTRIPCGKNEKLVDSSKNLVEAVVLVPKCGKRAAQFDTFAF